MVIYCTYVGVAKLVIALACHAGDRGFDPRLSRTNNSRHCLELFFLTPAKTPDFEKKLRKKLRENGKTCVTINRNLTFSAFYVKKTMRIFRKFFEFNLRVH